MDNPGEILRLCRLCLVKDQVNIPIFEEQGDIRQIFLKISSCLPVKVSRDDQLPKKICDGCSNKLDLFYEFWNTSANAEKTLLSWLGQAGVKDADETISAVTQQIAKPAETQVKQEALEDGHANQVQDSFASQSFEEEAKDESEAPPPKRARRTAAVKAQINITPESDDDDDMDNAEAMTKVEDESEESDGEDKDPSYSEVPGTSADDQAGPSGVGKDGVEAPILVSDDQSEDDTKPNIVDMLAISMNSTFSCSTCFKTFATLNNLRRHKERYSHTEENFPISHNGDLPQLKTAFCDLCQKWFPTPRRLKQHTKSVHVENRAFVCTVCPKSYKTKNTLTQHLKTHKRTLVQCDICLKFLKNQHTLETHIKRHNQEYVAKCEHCGMKFVSVYELKSHMEVRHSEKVLCYQCGQEFSSKNTLSNHILTKHDPNFKKGTFKCDLCDKVFDIRRNLKRHIRTRHESCKKEYCCDLCGKVLTSSDGFKLHKLYHLGEKPLECKQCGKKFLRKSTLRWHIRTHTGEKPHECNFCEQAFSQPSALKRHLRGVHALMYPYVCLTCGDSFPSKLLYNNHIKGKHPETLKVDEEQD